MKFSTLIVALLIFIGHNAVAQEGKLDLVLSTASLKASLSNERLEKNLLELKVRELHQKLIEKEADSQQEESDNKFHYMLTRIIILIESLLLAFCTLFIKKLSKLNLIKKQYLRLEALNNELNIKLKAGMEPVRLAKIDLQDLKDKHEYKIELDKKRLLNHAKETAQDTVEADTNLAKLLEGNIKAEAINRMLSKDHARLIKVGQILGKFDSEDIKPLARELIEALNLVGTIKQ